MRCATQRSWEYGPAGALVAAAVFALTVAVTLGGCIGGGSVASPQGRSCTRSDCESGVTYTTSLQLGGVDPAALEITVCRNTVCATTALLQRDAALWQAILIGPLSGRIELTGAADPRQLRITLTGTAAALSDGDVYVVRVGVPGQAPLVDVTRPVSYELVRPDGGDCDAGCAQASLS
ncbi:MAG: hypothetical protein U1A78_14500 [Polyangia bacterium]